MLFKVCFFQLPLPCSLTVWWKGDTFLGTPCWYMAFLQPRPLQCLLATSSETGYLAAPSYTVKDHEAAQSPSSVCPPRPTNLWICPVYQANLCPRHGWNGQPLSFVKIGSLLASPTPRYRLHSKDQLKPFMDKGFFKPQQLKGRLVIKFPTASMSVSGEDLVTHWS